MTEKKKTAPQKENNPFLESVYRMEIDCARSGASTVVSGVVGIVEKSDDSIKLMTKIGSVTISGERLNISVFEYKTLQISGKIESITFSIINNQKGKRLREIR